MLAGEAGDSGKIPGGHSQPGPHRSSSRDSETPRFVQPLFPGVLQTKAGQKDRHLEPRGDIGRAHDTRTGSAGRQKAFTGCSEHSKTFLNRYQHLQTRRLETRL